jgi:SAM-dependent MidA family methyltransferase
MTRSATPSILPALSADEARHSAAVEHLIRERIAAAGGWLSFDAFMELALYAPGLGYYSAGTAKLGTGGDFITAPELSDSFSRCVATQCAEILAVTGGEILELGAGSGRMAATILESLAALGVLPEHYRILEVSADLRARQTARIATLPQSLRDRVSWLDRLPEAPIQGIMLANEVLDALPCHRFVVQTDGIHALGVGIGESGGLVECVQAAELQAAENSVGKAHARQIEGASGVERASRVEGADEQVRAEVTRISQELPAPLPVGYRSELCLRIAPWIASLADRLGRGVALLFDYGLPRAHYYHPQRSSGTLRCHFKQRAHDDPLINIGVQDITAWVDFTSVAEAAVANGLDVLGFTTQAAFLLGAGMQSPDSDASTVEQARWAGEARQLLLPGEMGETFKAIALGRNYDAPLRGFALQDLRRFL